MNDPSIQTDYVNLYPKNIIRFGGSHFLHLICADATVWWDLDLIEANANDYPQIPLIIQGDTMSPLMFFSAIYNQPNGGFKYPLNFLVTPGMVETLPMPYIRIHQILIKVACIIFADNTPISAIRAGISHERVGGIYKWDLVNQKFTNIGLQSRPGNVFQNREFTFGKCSVEGLDRFYYSIFDTMGL